MPPDASPAFERFRFSFFEDTDSARLGLDTAALAALAGDERVRAEEMLIQALPDMRAVIGLGVLRARQAEPRLAALFDAEQHARRDAKGSSDWRPYALIFLAKALWQIRPDARRAAAIIEVLAANDDAIVRQEAAQALYDMRDPAVKEALITALDDAEALVRHHAARALLATYGLPTDAQDPAHMLYRVMSKDAARRESGKRDILAATESTLGG
jgi:HEAT repeat protein